MHESAHAGDHGWDHAGLTHSMWGLPWRNMHVSHPCSVHIPMHHKPRCSSNVLASKPGHACCPSLKPKAVHVRFFGLWGCACVNRQTHCMHKCSAWHAGCRGSRTAPMDASLRCLYCLRAVERLHLFSRALFTCGSPRAVHSLASAAIKLVLPDAVKHVVGAYNWP